MRRLLLAAGALALAALGCSRSLLDDTLDPELGFGGSGGQPGVGGSAGQPGEDAGPDVMNPCGAGQKPCDGVCVSADDPLTGCASSGCAPCEAPNAAPKCADDGTCAVAECEGGWADCDQQAANGCEIFLPVDVSNCGACGVGCSLPHAIPVCVAGVCQAASCDPGFGDCVGGEDGCETDLSSDAVHCGSCGKSCMAPGAKVACVNSVCVIASCDPGKADCDGLASTGCEIDLTGSEEHCGACGNACSAAHATSACVAGGCQLAACDGGYEDCDKDPSNGCEANLLQDVGNCGGCGVACVTPHGQPSCANTFCGIALCDAGWLDCNAVASDGCEIDVTSDAANCGSCGISCNFAHAASHCSAASCQMDACEQGWGNCDALASNGCESWLPSDLQNCGSCGVKCAPANATGACTSGACQIGGCKAGYADCNAAVVDGCEISVGTDPANCGGCGTTCVIPGATAKCDTGVCAIGACNAGRADCNGQLADGCEVSIADDPINCGTCGKVCSFQHASALCVAQACTLGACTAPWADCDAQPANGCEINLATSTTNCGACGEACQPANGVGACSTGVCTVALCNPGYADCNASASDGCEADLSASAAHCGACNKPCAPANATGVCVGGTCKVAGCIPLFGDCDANAANGCETALSGNPANCGGCGVICPSFPHAGAKCTQGVCSMGTCDAGWADCDGSAANGCEVNLAADGSNCGSCGHGCQGGACASQACQPLVLVSGQQNPWSIAVDAQYVYWDTRIASGAVLKVPVDGGPYTTLAADQPEPEGLAIDPGEVYWANFADGTIMSIPLSGGTPTMLAFGQNGPDGIAVFNGDVFWTNWNGNTVMRLASGGGVPQVLASGQSAPHRITSNGVNVWWANWGGNTVRRVPVTGGALTTVASSPQPIGVVVDATNVYWTDSGSVLKAPLAGGAVTTLASGQTHPTGIVVDATHVYFACYAASGTVRKVPLAGGQVVTLASGQNGPMYMAIDATSIYWTNAGAGTVMKLAK